MSGQLKTARAIVNAARPSTSRVTLGQLSPALNSIHAVSNLTRYSILFYSRINLRETRLTVFFFTRKNASDVDKAPVAAARLVGATKASSHVPATGNPSLASKEARPPLQGDSRNAASSTCEYPHYDIRLLSSSDTSRFSTAKEYAPINLDRLQHWIKQGRLTSTPDKPITAQDLLLSGCVHGVKDGVKLLGAVSEILRVPR